MPITNAVLIDRINTTGPTHIATARARSPLPLTFSLIENNAKNNKENDSKPIIDLVVYYFNGSEFYVTPAFRNILTVLDIEFHAFVRIADNRTSCNETGTPVSGPCVIDIPVVTISTYFQPSCPESIFYFSSTNQTAVTWTPPALRNNLTLLSTRASGDMFGLGSEIVRYWYKHHPSATPQVQIACEFKVMLAVLSCCCLAVDCCVSLPAGGSVIRRKRCT